MGIKDTLRLTARQRASLDAIISSQAAQKAVDEVEGKRLAERRTLVAELQALEALAARETPAAVEEKRTADAELQRLEAALPIARQRVVDAANRAHQAERTKPRGKLERQLRDSADPRIRDWRYYMEALANAASANFRTAASVQLTVFGSRLVTTTNADEVQRVRSLLAECIATTHRLELQPLSYAEVSESLSEMGHRLQGPLSKLGLNPPQLATDGEVGPPMPWADGWASTWCVEEINEPRRPALEEVKP